ncbi:MAG: hypothetical protein ACFFDI_25935, partial [Promethearchaeota archaeon]
MLSQYFFDQNIPFAIIGGVAIILQGRFRATEDIDLVILHKKLDIDSFIEFCKKISLSVEKYDLIEGFKERSHITIFDLPNFIRIDLKGAYTSWDKGVIEEAEN